MSKLSKQTLALGAGFVFFSLAIALVAGYVFSIRRATARRVQKTTKVTASAPSRLQGAAVRREDGLRVCADPNDLPFSNELRQGFENKIAALLGRDLGEPVEYTWWSERQNFVRNTLEAGRCDIVMGLPEGMPGALTTAPYYRSAYVFAYRKGRKLDIRSLNDPLLRRLRIGVNVVGNDYAPPARALAERGVIKNVSGYSLFGSYSDQNPSAQIINAVASGQIDVAVVWGPLAGYFARREPVPIAIVPVSPEIAGPLPLAYGISVGVAESKPRLESQVQQALNHRRTEIRQILSSYGVPLVS